MNFFWCVVVKLENTVAGGQTPFIDAGVAAQPIRGSAVLW